MLELSFAGYRPQENVGKLADWLKFAIGTLALTGGSQPKMVAARGLDRLRVR